MKLNEFLSILDEYFEERKNLILSYLSVVIIGIIFFYNFLMPLYQEKLSLEYKLHYSFKTLSNLKNELLLLKKKKQGLLKEIASLRDDLKYINMRLSMEKKIYCNKDCIISIYKNVLGFTSNHKLSVSYKFNESKHKIYQNLFVKKFSIFGSNVKEERVEKFSNLVAFIKDIEGMEEIVTFNKFYLKLNDSNKSFNYKFDINVWSL